MRKKHQEKFETPFLNAVEAGKLIGVNPKTVLRMMQLGQLKSVLMVKRLYVRRSEVLSFIEMTK